MVVVIDRSDRFPLFFVDGEVPGEVREELDEELSYLVKGHRGDDRFKKGEWDGKEHLLKKTPSGGLYFPAGLLTHVTEILTKHGVAYRVHDAERMLPPVLDLQWLKYRLRPYQHRAVNTFLNTGRGTISLPTGTGKTLIGLRIIYELQRPALIIIHQKEVADQWVKKIRNVLGVEAAQYYGGKKENGLIQVALFQSIYQDGQVQSDIKLDHDVFIADEVHRVGAQTFSRVAMACSGVYRLGLSATPKRNDGADLKIWAGTGPVITHYTPEFMVEKGYLARPVFKIFDVAKAGAGYESWRDEYREEIVESQSRNTKIAEEATKLAQNSRAVYIHVERIRHGEILEDLIQGARFVHGSSKDRDAVIEGFRQGRLPILISTLLGEGFDAPVMDAIIMAGGMKSEVMTVQKIGRALRPNESGTAVIIDFKDQGRWVGKHYAARAETYKEYYGRYFRPTLLGKYMS